MYNVLKFEASTTQAYMSTRGVWPGPWDWDRGRCRYAVLHNNEIRVQGI